MSPRPGGGLSRSAREKRAYTMVLVGGGSAAVAVIGFVLAVFGIGGFGIPFLAAIVAALSFVFFRRTVGS